MADSPKTPDGASSTADKLPDFLKFDPFDDTPNLEFDTQCAEYLQALNPAYEVKKVRDKVFVEENGLVSWSRQIIRDLMLGAKIIFSEEQKKRLNSDEVLWDIKDKK